MEHITTLKNIICTAAGIVGACISQLFGGWTGAMTTLLIFMGLDYQKVRN